MQETHSGAREEVELVEVGGIGVAHHRDGRGAGCRVGPDRGALLVGELVGQHGQDPRPGACR